jgi:DNA-binding winged helix-turn-helix (wHTH) protein
MPDSAASVCYRFGRFELQPDERRLLAAGSPVRVGPHAFDLLTALVERSGRLVTKDELLERVSVIRSTESTVRFAAILLKNSVFEDARRSSTG